MVRNLNKKNKKCQMPGGQPGGGGGMGTFGIDSYIITSLRFFKLCKNQSFETNTFTQSSNNLVRLLFRKLAFTGF